jgi:hypothetical protein
MVGMVENARREHTPRILHHPHHPLISFLTLKSADDLP